MLVSPHKLWLDGVEVRDVGGVPMTLPNHYTPAKNYITYKIPGRSGVLTRWKGDYLPLEKPVEIACDKSRLSAVENALSKARSVRFSNDPDFIYDCFVAEEVQVKSLNPSDRLVMAVIICQPLKRAVTEASQTAKTATIANPDGTAAAYPKIVLPDPGSFTINGQTWTVSGTGAITIDSLTNQVSDANGNAWKRLNRSDLPVVAEGANLVYSTTLASLTITPQWRYT